MLCAGAPHRREGGGLHDAGLLLLVQAAHLGLDQGLQVCATEIVTSLVT